MYKIIFLFLALLSGCGNNIETQRVNKEVLLELMHFNPKTDKCNWSYGTFNYTTETEGYTYLQYLCIPATATIPGSSVIVKITVEILEEEYKGIGDIVIYKGKKIIMPQGAWESYKGAIPKKVWEAYKK